MCSGRIVGVSLITVKFPGEFLQWPKYFVIIIPSAMLTADRARADELAE